MNNILLSIAVPFAALVLWAIIGFCRASKKKIPSFRCGERCPRCGEAVFSNGVNVWCEVCDYGRSVPVAAEGAKESA